MDLGFAERKTIIYEAALEGGGGGDPRSGARKREKEKERRNGAPHRLHRFCPLLSSPNFVQVCTRGKRRCQVSNRAACAVDVRNTPSSIPNLLSLSLSLCPTPPSRDFLIKDRRKLGSSFARNWRPTIKTNRGLLRCSAGGRVFAQNRSA